MNRSRPPRQSRRRRPSSARWKPTTNRRTTALIVSAGATSQARASSASLSMRRLRGRANPTRPTSRLQLLKAEALLAVGRHEAAGEVALAAAQLAQSSDDPAAAGQALKLWAVARFRQRQVARRSGFRRRSGETARRRRRGRDAPLLARHACGSELLINWTPPVDREPVRGASLAQRSPADLCAIEARANGVALPLVFIDTGAQHTLDDHGGRAAAGVTIGETATQLVGFAGLRAQPGVLETLQLGGLTLHNVPMLVGDSAPLVALNGQMALGTELMHHVCFTIDYPAGRVLAEPADRGGVDADRRIELANPAVDVFASLPRAGPNRQRRGGPRAGRYRQSDRHVRLGALGAAQSARYSAVRTPDWSSSSNNEIWKSRSLEFGDQSLADWPVVDTLPGSLERLDLVDVLVGHDLLGSYQVTIDLAAANVAAAGPLAARGTRARAARRS